MEAFQQVLEDSVAFVLDSHATSKGAAERRGYSGLVRQAFDTDDTPIHVLLAFLVLRMGIARH